MSESLAIGRCRAAARASGTHAAPLDGRRKLQLALGGLWLLDGILQFQPSMFTKAFPEMLAGTSAGNPAFVASPVNWSAALITHHLVVLNAIFATIQVALGLGIAWRPTVRLALAASVLWSLAVWFLGEGLGGVLAGPASLTDGAPGAVILYALLAVLLWPTDRGPTDRGPADQGSAATERPSVHRRPCRRRKACPGPVDGALGQHGVLRAAARLPHPAAASATRSRRWPPGSPAGWPGRSSHLAGLLAGPGLLAASLLAAAFAVTALGVWLPARAASAAKARPAPADRPGPRAGRVPVAGPGPRRRVHRRQHRPQLRPAARPARPGLLARGRQRKKTQEKKEPDMAGPGWLTGLLAAVMLTVAAYNATRLVAAPRWGRAAELDADGMHVVMGVAMAGMLTPGLSFAPARLWQAVFAAAGAWFGWQFLRTRSGQAAWARGAARTPCRT